MNNNVNKWRFPKNNYSKETGLSTPEMETFKNNPLGSLGREICQNSIDAKDKNIKGPVKVVFKEFEIKRDEIPGYEDLKNQIKSCKNTWINHKETKKELSLMEEKITSDTIVCLRISDFNTTGLNGVEGTKNTPWDHLIHGSGISEKSETSGGSKGIGKNASFIHSEFRTVIYSTLTNKGNYGYEGISNLCSANIEGTDEKTQGIGYFSSNIKNAPVKDKFNLDRSFKRENSGPGTDIYILGFRRTKDWIKKIVSSIIDSFIVAIFKERLEVEIGDYLINLNNLEKIIKNEEIIEEKLRKSIFSQFILLSDNRSHIKEIEINGYGSIHLYFMELDGEYKEYASKKCSMVRYPYMKIKDENNFTTFNNVSALCIIEDNEINKILRKIENPQHDNWINERIDDPAAKEEVKSMRKQIKQKIETCIRETIAKDDGNSTDIYGVNEYFLKINKDNQNEKKKNIRIGKKIKNSFINKKATIEDPLGKGLSDELFEYEEEENSGDEILAASAVNEKRGGIFKPGNYPINAGEKEGEKRAFKTAKLRGNKYSFFCLEKNTGTYVIVFTCENSYKNLKLKVESIDYSNKKSIIEIYEYKFKNNWFNNYGRNIIELDVEKDEKNEIILKTDQKDLFSCEVNIYGD